MAKVAETSMGDTVQIRVEVVGDGAASLLAWLRAETDLGVMFAWLDRRHRLARSARWRMC